MVLSGNNEHDEGIASSKRRTQLKTRVHNSHTLFQTKMAKLGILFHAKKTLPFGAPHTYTDHTKEYYPKGAHPHPHPQIKSKSEKFPKPGNLTL